MWKDWLQKIVPILSNQRFVLILCSCDIVTGIPVSDVDVQDILDTFKWQCLNDVYPHLGITPRDIDNATLQNPLPNEQARFLLNLWRNREDNAATRDRMIAAMEKFPNYRADTNELKRTWKMVMERS